MVIPAFKPFTNKFWPDISAELSDFSVIKKYSSCEHGPYCLGYTCVFDFYPTSQKDQLEKLEPRIQEILEEAEFVPHEQGDIEQYKAYLEDQDLIELLPGVVPGFALRNRSWGRCNLRILVHLKAKRTTDLTSHQFSLTWINSILSRKKTNGRSSHSQKAINKLCRRWLRCTLAVQKIPWMMVLTRLRWISSEAKVGVHREDVQALWRTC